MTDETPGLRAVRLLCGTNSRRNGWTQSRVFTGPKISGEQRIVSTLVFVQIDEDGEGEAHSVIESKDESYIDDVVEVKSRYYSHHDGWEAHLDEPAVVACLLDYLRLLTQCPWAHCIPDTRNWPPERWECCWDEPWPDSTSVGSRCRLEVTAPTEAEAILLAIERKVMGEEEWVKRG